ALVVSGDTAIEGEIKSKKVTADQICTTTGGCTFTLGSGFSSVTPPLNLNAGNLALGTVGVVNGGTGLTSSGAPGTYLKSDGAGGWAVGSIPAADLPSFATLGNNNFNGIQTIGSNITENPTTGNVTANSFTGTQFSVAGTAGAQISESA